MRFGLVHRSASHATVTSAAIFAMASLLACAVPEVAPPPAEFLVATPDSTYWVQTGTGGVRVRGVPMTLAAYDGRFHEVYVAGVDRSYTDAIFVGERLYQRDLIKGDSTLILDDSAVIAAANRYARATPRARELDPDDPDPEDPNVSITGETDILGVRGPYVWIEHRASVQSEDEERYDTTQTAIDLRSARPVDPQQALRRAAQHDSVTAVPLPMTWHRRGFDLVVRHDTASGAVTLTLRDAVRRSWPVLSVGATPRIYWIDSPAIDAATRSALRRAFNAAAQYDEAVRFASWPMPSGPSAHAPTRLSSAVTSLL